MTAADVIAAWDQADPIAIHPLRRISEDAYWQSGKNQADLLSTVLPKGCKVVDFGVGDGRVAIPLRALGYDVTGADASPAMLARLAERDGMPTVTSTGADLSEQLGRKVDAVICLAVLIHHSYADCLDLIAGLRAAVNGRNGLLVLDWPVSEPPTEAQNWIGVTTWSQDQQDKACARLGLKRLDAGLPWGVFKAVKAG